MINLFLTAVLTTIPTIDYISHLSPTLDPYTTVVIAQTVDNHCEGLDKKVVLSIIMHESGFNIDAFNKDSIKGIDLGVMQLNTYWQRTRINRYGLKRWQVWAIDDNIMLGCEIIRELQETRGNRYKYYWAFYHSKTRERRITYIKLVNRYLRKLKRFDKTRGQIQK